MSMLKEREMVSSSGVLNDYSAVNESRHLLKRGTINFKNKANGDLIASRPYIYIDKDIDLDSLYRTMTNVWKEVKSPNLVVSLINSISSYKPFKTFKISETLRDGIQNIVDYSQVWFIGNGINVGLPQIIGTVVQETIALRADDVLNGKTESSPKTSYALTFLGIISDRSFKQLTSSLTADETSTTIELSIDKRKKYCFNSNHTHLIIVRENVSVPTLSNDTKNKPSTAECDEELIDSATSSANQFRESFEQFLRQTKTPSATNAKKDDADPLKNAPFPMVYISGRGTPEAIKVLQQKMQKSLPIVIIKGNGGAADIIAHAYETINTKSNKTYDEDQLKKDLNLCLLDEYGDKWKDQMTERDKICDDIVYIAKENKPSKLKLLNVIDINSPMLSSNEIHKTILLAYLKSQKVTVEDETKALIQQNTLVKLTLDWGLVDTVQSELFEREDFLGYTIPDDLFEQALLGENLEAFVDLFLERGFSLDHYLKSEVLRNFFDRQKDRDFFTTTSLEGILGWSGDENSLPRCFIEHTFNDIIERLTNIEIDIQKDFRTITKLHHSSVIPDETPHYQQMRAETKAIRSLVICAVLTNRHSLAKILWKRTSEPIPLALICSMMSSKLKSYCREPYQKSLIEKQAKKYTDYAMGVLDKSFKEDEIETFRMLSTTRSDLDDMTVIQLAYNWDNKEFLSHAILQKWVIRSFYDNITPRELSWGFVTCPIFLKIILSALLIFPMWFWISFSPIGSNPLLVEKNQRSQPDNECKDESPIADKKSCGDCRDHKMIKAKKITPLQRIQLLWDAPITKFYTHSIAYSVFLILLTVAVVWPSCGNLLLDCIVCLWGVFIAVDSILTICHSKSRSREFVSWKRVVFEIIPQVTFLFLYFNMRIIGLRIFGTDSIVTAKVVLGFGLVYYYYRVLFIYFPMSSKFGPMMIRLKYMICDDFVTFLQLFGVFMISSGVAITAILYPHHPLGWELFNKAILFRGLMALFTTQISDLQTSFGDCTINATTGAERKSVCSALSHSNQYDRMSNYERYGVSTPFCRQTSWIVWLLVIQYFFLAKRILISLLTALFSVTGARIQKQSEQIWCYNQYTILMEYKTRTRLPPPFTFISYLIELIKMVWDRCGSIRCLHRFFKKRNITNIASTDIDKASVTEVLIVTPEDTHSNTAQLNATSSAVKKTNKEPSTYWKHTVKEYFLHNQATEAAKDSSKGMSNVQKDIDGVRKSLLQSNDRIVTLEETMNHSHVLLEKICLMISQKGPTFMTDNQIEFVHVYSRQSPYAFTNEARFMVPEKFVPWTISDQLYRPTLITLPKEHNCFSDNDRSFVESHWSPTIESPSTTSVAMSNVDFPLSGNKSNTQPPLPQNPVGRTGVQGRGALIRWGANKSVIAIVTRRKKVDNEFVIVHGRPILETIIFIDQNTHNCKFPEGKILGEESSYGAICQVFNEFVLQDKACECNSSFQKQNMIEFFESLTRSNKVESLMITKGYIDDVRNTDNAWVEAEVWNFHYDSIMPFPPLRNDETVLWESLTDRLRRTSVQTSILQKIAQLHGAYFD